MISTLPAKPQKLPQQWSHAMEDLLMQFAAYNIWASHRLLDLINALPEEKQKTEVPNSFKSLYATVLHMWDAEGIWWQPMKMQERIIRPSENFIGTMQDVCNGLMSQSNQWKDWVATATDLSLNHVFQNYDNKTEHFKMPVYQMLHHVFNHGTYHRGQLVNMLRQLGVEKIPQMDFPFGAGRSRGKYENDVIAPG